MQFSGFAVSVRGASHEDSGTPCQDSARVLITDKLAVAAVSDGHGSEKHFRSASGSEMAARVALRSVTDFCERNGVPPRPKGGGSAYRREHHMRLER